MKHLGEEVHFFHSGWPLKGIVVEVEYGPGIVPSSYVVKCDKFLGARFHFNKDDQIVWVENVLQSK